MAEAPRTTAPFAGFEWILSGRYLRARRREGMISVIAGFSFAGIMLGVATLIVVMAVMNGFRAQLLDKILGFEGHAVAIGSPDPIKNYEAIADRLGKVNGVTAVIPFVEGQVMASSPFSSTGAIVRGMSEASLRQLPGIANGVEVGTLEGFDAKDGVAVGAGVASRHGLTLGDKITLISPHGPVTPFGRVPRAQSFEVVAIFRIGMSQYDKSVVFMPLKLAQGYFLHEGTVSNIDIKVEDPDNIETYLAPLTKALEAGVQLRSWQSRNSVFFGALQVERNVMFMILTLIILVAALNIISGLIMLVKDKSRDIAILRTMGATRGAVMRVFLITGTSIGVTGTLAGLLLGLLFCAGIEEIQAFVEAITRTKTFPPELYYLSRLPAEVDPKEVTAVVVMSIVLSITATLYPSWRAARLDPVEALRYE